MTQPIRQHRREIWASLCLSYDTVSDILWRAALDGGQAAGTCSKCGQLMKPRQPEEHAGRMHYEACCMGCGRVVEGLGPRLPKPTKGV
jgi:hypothetical protein